MRLICILLLIIGNCLALPSAKAVYGGELALGSSFVVPIFISEDTSNPFCSGVAIEADVVVSAAHCFGVLGTTGEKLNWKTEDIRVAEPGLNTNEISVLDTINVKFAIFPRSYENYYDPVLAEYRSQKNDIIFFVLSSKLKTFKPIKIADFLEVDTAKKNLSTATFLGYGPVGPNLAKDGKPYQLLMKSAPARWATNHPADKDETIFFDGLSGSGLCGGDSGGPWFLNFDSEPILLAVTIGANGCGPTSQPINAAGTLVSPYLKEFRIKREQLEESIEKSRIEISSLLERGFKISEFSGCHGFGTKIEFKYRWREVHQTISKAMGWDTDNCPSGMGKPWVAAELVEGTPYTWTISDPNGAWSFMVERVFSRQNSLDSLAEKAEAKAKAEAEAKAKAEADAKAKAEADVKAKAEAEAKAKAEADAKAKAEAEAKVKAEADAKAALSKKRTITCAKGKLIKKVTAVNPKCPKGYKKK